VFRALAHDFNAKTALGQAYPAGGGENEGVLLLERLAAHPSTAAFISRKLARRFVADNPPQALIDRLAQTYLATSGNIKSVMRDLLNSAEFRTSQDNKLKRPNEYVAGIIRVLNGRVGPQFYRVITERLTELNQVPFNWPAPNGYPDVQGYWTNTSSVLTRWNFAFEVVEGRIPAAVVVNMDSLVPLVVATPVQIVDALAQRLLRRPLATNDRDTLIGIAAAGGSIDRPLRSSARGARIREVSGLMLSSPYFQYR